MSLRTVSFQDTYWSGENDLIKEFYVPCMEESIEYCRAVGYFSSSILCYITNGLYPFIQNGGRMRIVCSVNLSPEDERQIALGYDIRHLLEDKILALSLRVLSILILPTSRISVGSSKTTAWTLKCAFGKTPMIPARITCSTKNSVFSRTQTETQSLS